MSEHAQLIIRAKCFFIALGGRNRAFITLRESNEEALRMRGQLLMWTRDGLGIGDFALALHARNVAILVKLEKNKIKINYACIVSSAQVLL